MLCYTPQCISHVRYLSTPFLATIAIQVDFFLRGLLLRATLAGDTAEDFPTTFHVQRKRSARRAASAQATGIVPLCLHTSLHVFTLSATYFPSCLHIICDLRQLNTLP